MKTMRPLPFLPTAPILRPVPSAPGLVQRLELWNLTAESAGTTQRELDHVVISVAPDLTAEPALMVTTRPPRTADYELHQATDTARLVPAARQSILTIPLDADVPGWPDSPDRMQVAEQLLAALANDQAPWTTVTVDIDGEEYSFRALTWPSGALWVGAYRDVTVSIVGRELLPERLQLAAMTDDEVRALAETSQA